jgi:hypothetical protein
MSVSLVRSMATEFIFDCRSKLRFSEEWIVYRPDENLKA